MTTDTVKLLARYNTLANQKMNECISQLTNSEWEKELGGFFPSVKSTNSHIYIVDVLWLRRLRTLRTFTSLNNPLVDKSHSLDASPFNVKEEYLHTRMALDTILNMFADEITDANLGGTLKYTNIRGEEQKKNFGGLLMHVFNHQTHHRGMISIYLDMLGKSNDFSGMVELV